VEVCRKGGHLVDFLILCVYAESYLNLIRLLLVNFFFNSGICLELRRSWVYQESVGRLYQKISLIVKTYK
jgi:hypothetical protein